MSRTTSGNAQPERRSMKLEDIVTKLKSLVDDYQIDKMIEAAVQTMNSEVPDESM